MVPMMKKPTKKPVVKKGLFMRKSVNGISVHIHFGGGNKACALTGYNQSASVQKALLALNRTLNGAFDHMTGKFDVVDERKVVKKK